MAIYKTEEFRRIYTREYARVYMLTSLQEDAMIEDQTRASKDYDEFLVSIYTPERQWDDFSQKDSLWKVYLIRDGRFRIEPLEIRKLKKTGYCLNPFIPLYLIGRVSISSSSRRRIRINLLNQ